MLLSFGDAIARSKRSPEKLFVLLDMYEIMRELHTEVIIFSLISLSRHTFTEESSVKWKNYSLVSAFGGFFLIFKNVSFQYHELWYILDSPSNLYSFV